MHPYIIAAGVIGIAAFVFVPGLSDLVLAALTGEHPTCYVSGIDPWCNCPGETKHQTAMGVTWFCEENPEDLVINPENGTFVSDSIAYAKDFLRSEYPDCTVIDCPSPAEITVVVGESYWEDGSWTDRKAFVECRIPLGHVYWEVWIDVENGDTLMSSCQDIVPETEGLLSVDEFKRICQANIVNEHCNAIFHATDNQCAVHEIFPGWDCSSGSTCTKGVTYGYGSVKDNPDWTGCGYLADQSWAEGG